MTARNSNHSYDVLVVGAGPAGLAVAHGLVSSGLSVAVVDSGKPVLKRGRYAETDITQGVGGAGLFSDGKFSFYPSATKLWELDDRVLLQRAYSQATSALTHCSLKPPVFPKVHEKETVKDGWQLKNYPSYYVALSDRIALTEWLVQESGADFITSTTLASCRFRKKLQTFICQLNMKGHRQSFSARYLVFAGGRFGPINFPLSVAQTFKWLEVGCRIEQPSSLAFFQHLPQLDPKLKLASAKQPFEWRTFCACRDGEITLTRTQGLWAVSGRADCPPTGRSNIGLNVRIYDAELAAKATSRLQKIMSEKGCYFRLPLAEVYKTSNTRRRLEYLYGDKVLSALIAGIDSLNAAFPGIISPESFIVGPALEGVGNYPTTNNDLRIPTLPAWVAGDSTGKFRGIVAALVSGFYVAEQILAA